jgi:serine/threonine protein kinase
MAATSTILSKGEMLGGYRIEDVIGFGGMAIVYRAEQVALGRHVALKVLAPQLSHDEAFRERFRREGRHVAALDHPHVLTIFDSGDIDGRLYLAMRLVDGGTLADRMQHEGLSADETLRVLTPVADALDAAHAEGLVHRDVKPQNILISRSGHAYLADFGVAKGSSTTLGLTATGGFVGSVNYASPEQIRGERTTAAGDVYALAAVLYQCLTGQVPYPRDTEAGVMYAHLHEPTPTLPSLSPEAQKLDQVIGRGMAKDAPERYQHARDLLNDAYATITQLPARQRRAIPTFSLPKDGVLKPNCVHSQAPRENELAVVSEPSPIANGTSSKRSKPRRKPRHPAPGPIKAKASAADASALTDGTEIVSADERRNRRLSAGRTAVDRRREPIAPQVEPARASNRHWRLAFAGCAGILILVTAVVVLTAGDGSGNAVLSSARSGPLRLTYQSPWRVRLGSLPGAFALSSPILLGSGEVTLAAGPVTHSAPVPGGSPPQLVARFGKPASQRNIKIADNSATLYSWRLRAGRRLVTLVIATTRADLALTCAASRASPASALASCTRLAATATITGVQLLPPGPDTKLDASLNSDLAPVAAARAHLSGLSTTNLPARAAPAAAIARLERATIRTLNNLRPPQRNARALSNLTDALGAEASAFALLGHAARTNKGSAYANASADLTAASRTFSTAANALSAQGFKLAPLQILKVPGVPPRPQPPAKASSSASAGAGSTPLPTASTVSPTTSTPQATYSAPAHAYSPPPTQSSPTPAQHPSPSGPKLVPAKPLH